MVEEELEHSRKSTIMKLYMRISALSFSNSAVSPVLPYLIVYYGGGATESGFFQAFNNLFGNLGQVLWGRVSDVSGLRKLLLALGSFSALLTPLILISILVSTNSLNPYLIILVSAIATFLGSASAPIIAPVISELAKSSKESVHLFAIHSNLSTFFSILGNVVATLILQAYLQSAVQGFANLFIIALLSAAIALTASLSIPRTVVDIRRGEHYKGRGFVHEFGKVVEGFRNSLKNPRFRGFAFTNTLYNLSMSIAWPLFILTQKNVLNLSPAQITTFSIASSVTTIASQYMMGMLLRRELYRFLTLLNRFGLVVVPLVYAYATNYTQLLLLNIYTGFLSGFTNIIFPMYIIECAGDGNRATYIGVYNMLIGTASFTGSLIGGSISTKLIESFGLIQGLKITYYICTIARIFSALLTLKSKEYVF